MCVHTQLQPQNYHDLFSRFKTKQDDADVFWWIFSHVSLLKLEKDVKDDNRYSVLQMGIVSSRKYCDLTIIESNEYSTTLYAESLCINILCIFYHAHFICQV